MSELNSKQDVFALSADPCRSGQPFSLQRFIVFTLLFLIFMPVGFVLIILLSDCAFGIQFASIIMDTAAVALYTFSSNRNGNPPYMLSCPVVRQQLPILLRRHMWFLALLFVLQTAAFQLQPHLSSFWNTPTGRDPSPSVVVLTALCVVLAVTQILTNRSVLGAAHPESSEPRQSQMGLQDY